jgi:two-component system LytT family response regulator
MPRLGGLEVCQKLADADHTAPLVIFVTAYDEFAVRAFELRAFDYLLKPFDRERLRKALENVRHHLRNARPGLDPRDLKALLEELKPAARNPERLVFRENGRVVFLPIGAIDWAEADGNYVRVHAGAEAHYFRETLSGLEAQLPPDKFIRISRSALVNLDRIKELQPLFYGDYLVLLHNGSRLNLSRAYRDRLEGVLGQK